MHQPKVPHRNRIVVMIRIGYTFLFVDLCRVVGEIGLGRGFIIEMALMMLSIITVFDAQAVAMNMFRTAVLAANAMAAVMVEHRRHTEDGLHTKLGLRLVLEVNNAEQLIPMQSKRCFFDGRIGAFRLFFCASGNVSDICFTCGVFK